MSYAIFLFKREHILSLPQFLSQNMCIYTHLHTKIMHLSHINTHTHTHKVRHRRGERKKETGWFTLRFTGCKLGTREGEKASTAQKYTSCMIPIMTVLTETHLLRTRHPITTTLLEQRFSGPFSRSLGHQNVHKILK